jgi:hypothetical protein
MKEDMQRLREELKARQEIESLKHDLQRQKDEMRHLEELRRRDREAADKRIDDLVHLMGRNDNRSDSGHLRNEFREALNDQARRIDQLQDNVRRGVNLSAEQDLKPVTDRLDRLRDTIAESLGRNPSPANVQVNHDVHMQALSAQLTAAIVSNQQMQDRIQRYETFMTEFQQSQRRMQDEAIGRMAGEFRNILNPPPGVYDAPGPHAPPSAPDLPQQAPPAQQPPPPPPPPPPAVHIVQQMPGLEPNMANDLLSRLNRLETELRAMAPQMQRVAPPGPDAAEIQRVMDERVREERERANEAAQRVLEANQTVSSVLHNNYKDQDRSFYSFSAIIYRSISLLISFSESCTAYSWTGPGDYCKV